LRFEQAVKRKPVIAELLTRHMKYDTPCTGRAFKGGQPDAVRFREEEEE